MEIDSGNPFPFGPTTYSEGVNFALHAVDIEKISLCFFHENNHDTPFEEFDLNSKKHRTGDVWHALIKGLPPNCGYAYRISHKHQPDISRFILDPYAKWVLSDTLWHEISRKEHLYQPLGKILSAKFDWEGDKPLNLPKEDLIIYEMHVRGFTKHPSSHVKAPGTFLGLMEKIPYLLDLGITAVELMPIQEFDEEDVMHVNPTTQKKLHNYFGYSTVNFFAPMNRYFSQAADKEAINELKTLIKELHKNGIEVILDIVFNHTAEGNDKGPVISFKGLNPHAFYFINQENQYLNFSGCGNSVNANHPITREFIIEVLRYWVSEMHIDGFRFDLASELTRGLDGGPLDNPSLIESITKDPILANTKLIAEPWDAGGLYQLGKFAMYSSQWSEWNGKYQQVVRSFIKGSPKQRNMFAGAISGSHEVFPQSPYHSINYITSHDGFSLADLVSYNEKHNLPNGENNADGLSDNNSWNCSVEGETRNTKTLNLRQKQMRNFMLALMISEGIPMVLMGDEYEHTRQGNNNPWGQDNELNWFLWDRLENNRDFYSYVRFLIHFRKKHPLLRPKTFLTEKERQWHGLQPGQPDWEHDHHLIAFSLHYPDGTSGLFIAFNAAHTYQNITLPNPGEGKKWKWVVNTNLPTPKAFFEGDNALELTDLTFHLAPYSAIMLESSS